MELHPVTDALGGQGGNINSTGGSTTQAKQS